MTLKTEFGWMDFETLRRSPFVTMGVFISSFCPVGCGHCAVAASPRPIKEPSDLLIHGVDEMAQLPDLVAVAITGGEPFFEVELLEILVSLLNGANKHTVVYTSGYWGNAEIIRKIEPVLRSIDGLVIGVDLYHRAHIPDEDLINAIRCAERYGVWITAQVICGIDGEAHLDYAKDILKKAFGKNWRTRARVDKCPPLASGRAKAIRAFHRYDDTFEGFCHSVNGPTLLRDGTLTACCNEEIVQKKGPELFRVHCRGNLRQSLDEIINQPILRYLHILPPKVLFSLASYCCGTVKIEPPHRLCEACWGFASLIARMDEAQRKKFDLMVNIWQDAWNRRGKGHPSEMRASRPDAYRVSNV